MLLEILFEPTERKKEGKKERKEGRKTKETVFCTFNVENTCSNFFQNRNSNNTHI